MYYYYYNDKTHAIVECLLYISDIYYRIIYYKKYLVNESYTKPAIR